MTRPSSFGDLADTQGLPAPVDSKGGPESVVVLINSESEVGEARRAAARITSEAGLSDSDAGSIALVVTEAATNIARYGGSGRIILSNLRPRQRDMIEMIAVDKGAGIGDMSRALSDGFSTGGTPGKGLGAIRRMAAEFDLWSGVNQGTALVARVPISKAKSSPPAMSCGVVCKSIASERVCGDAWIIENIPDGVLIAVADGLGHGHEAAIAADYALSVVRRRRAASLSEIFDYANRALRPTRGAALQVARINNRDQTITSIGVGNISTSVSSHSASKSLPCQPGIVGHQMPRTREVTVPFTSESLLVMHSDGISSRWNLDAYPGLRARDPAITAAILYRDFARGRDDATMVTYRVG